MVARDDPTAAAAALEPGVDDLVRRVLAGETERFADIVRRHEREVWAVVSALPDPVLCENLLQQTFVNAFERLHQYRGDGLDLWLRRIARNLVTDELRRRAREGERLRHYANYLAVRFEAESTDDGERELAEAVRACRETLTSAPRRAVELYYDDGLSLERVAVALGRTVVATRQLLFRTRVALRECARRRLAHT
jgi:RNA polymerase sigma-70 factor (ECF subfamily)